MGYTNIVRALYKYYENRKGKNNCCEFVTVMTALITVAYSFATGNVGFPSLETWKPPHRQTNDEYLILLAQACGDKFAISIAKKFKFAARCLLPLAVILSAVELRGAILEETERLEREFDEMLQKDVDESHRKAVQKAKEIIDYEASVSNCRLVDREKLKEAIKVLTFQLQSRYLINKPINDPVIEFQKALSEACIDCCDPPYEPDLKDEPVS